MLGLAHLLDGYFNSEVDPGDDAPHIGVFLRESLIEMAAALEHDRRYSQRESAITVKLTDEARARLAAAGAEALPAGVTPLRPRRGGAS